MIFILSNDYASIHRWCSDHKIDIKDIVAIYSNEDVDKVYGFEIQNVITLPEFFRLSRRDYLNIFNHVCSRMRIGIR